MKPSYMGRWLFTSEGLVEGYLRVEEDSVREICYGAAPSESARALVVPGFVNAHTHIGDSIGFPAPRGSVQDTVGPLSSYKHRVLKSNKAEDKIAAMREAVREMNRTGCCLFADFREEGVDGLKQFALSLPDAHPRHLVLGRPESSDVSEQEIDLILDNSDGFGMSALRDWPVDFLRRLSSKAMSSRKMFAIHASETVREDIETILELKPSFLVHMLEATDSDLVACAEARVPVVVCPRSNEFFGLNLDIPKLLRCGLVVGLGTDNGMISRPNMLSELQAAFRTSVRHGGISPADAVNLATFGGHKVLNATGKILTEIGIQQDLVIIGVKSDDPLRELVTEAETGSILGIVRGGIVWRSEAWTR